MMRKFEIGKPMVPIGMIGGQVIVPQLQVVEQVNYSDFEDEGPPAVQKSHRRVSMGGSGGPRRRKLRYRC